MLDKIKKGIKQWELPATLVMAASAVFMPPVVTGILGIIGLLIIAAFKIGQITAEEKSGCTVYRLTR